jgi:hypothetical protein
LEVNAKLNLRSLALPLTLGFVLVLGAAFGSPCRSQGTEAACAEAVDQWGKIYQQLDQKLTDFSAIQQTRVERLVQHPLFETGAGKTIAKQIADALQAKEDILNVKRRECRETMNLEQRAYSQLQDCLGNGKDSRFKDAKKLVKQRNALLEKATLVLAEVKEVEGKDTNLPYTEAMRGQQDYGRGGSNSQWQNYQQMYRRWWGY